MIRLGFPRVKTILCLPRMRGDDPFPVEKRAVRRAFAPHARG